MLSDPLSLLATDSSLIEKALSGLISLMLPCDILDPGVVCLLVLDLLLAAKLLYFLASSRFLNSSRKTSTTSHALHEPATSIGSRSILLLTN